MKQEQMNRSQEEEEEKRHASIHIVDDLVRLFVLFERTGWTR